MTNANILLQNKRFINHRVNTVKFEANEANDDEADHEDRPEEADEDRAAQPVTRAGTCPGL